MFLCLIVILSKVGEKGLKSVTSLELHTEKDDSHSVKN